MYLPLRHYIFYKNLEIFDIEVLTVCGTHALHDCRACVVKPTNNKGTWLYRSLKNCIDNPPGPYIYIYICTGKFLLRWGGYGGGLVQPSRLICWIQSCGMMRTLSGVLRVYYRTFAADSRPPSDPSSENLNCGDDRIEKEKNNMLCLMSGFSKPCCFYQLQFSFQ